MSEYVPGSTAAKADALARACLGVSLAEHRARGGTIGSLMKWLERNPSIRSEYERHQRGAR